MKKIIILCLFLCAACATPKDFVVLDHNVPLSQIESAYNPAREKGFCLDRQTGEMREILRGTMIIPFLSGACRVPECRLDEIVAHTHPVFAEIRANFQDFRVWREIYEINGNRLFGVYSGLTNNLTVYKYLGK